MEAEGAGNFRNDRHPVCHTYRREREVAEARARALHNHGKRDQVEERNDFGNRAGDTAPFLGKVVRVCNRHIHDEVEHSPYTLWETGVF